MEEINYDELDPGIREVVRLLRDHGFETTDSGDGVTKCGAGWGDEALDFPHVFAEVAPADMVYEADRMLTILEAAPGEWRVEASYRANEGHACGAVAVLVAMGGKAAHPELAHDDALDERDILRARIAELEAEAAELRKAGLTLVDEKAKAMRLYAQTELDNQALRTALLDVANHRNHVVDEAG